MRVVPLESPLKEHQPLYVFDFLISVLNIWNNFKVLSRFMQKWTQPPACWDHGLHRILSSYWLAHCYLIKKIRSILGVDCGMMDASRNPKNNWCLSRIYGIRFGEKDHGLSTCKPWSEQARGLDSILQSAQAFEVFQNIQEWNKKFKTYSGWCPFKGLSNDATLMQIQSGRTVPLKEPRNRFPAWRGGGGWGDFSMNANVVAIYIYIFLICRTT